MLRNILNRRRSHHLCLRFYTRRGGHILTFNAINATLFFKSTRSHHLCLRSRGRLIWSAIECYSTTSMYWSTHDRINRKFRNNLENTCIPVISWKNQKKKYRKLFPLFFFFHIIGAAGNNFSNSFQQQKSTREKFNHEGIKLALREIIFPTVFNKLLR